MNTCFLRNVICFLIVIISTSTAVAGRGSEAGVLEEEPEGPRISLAEKHYAVTEHNDGEEVLYCVYDRRDQLVLKFHADNVRFISENERQSGHRDRHHDREKREEGIKNTKVFALEDYTIFYLKHCDRRRTDLIATIEGVNIGTKYIHPDYIFRGSVEEGVESAAVALGSLALFDRR